MTPAMSFCVPLYDKCGARRRPKLTSTAFLSGMDVISGRNPKCSARILVAVKSVQEAQSMLSLLLLRVVRRDDYLLFVHVVNHSGSSIKPPLLDDTIRTFFVSNQKTPKVTISTLTLEAPNIKNAIVEEARRIKATMVLLGCSHSPLLRRSMHETGKHCVKNLSCYSCVLIVRRDKVLHAKPGGAKRKERTLRAFLQRHVAEEKGKFPEIGTVDSAPVIVEHSSQSSCFVDTIIPAESTSTSCFTPSSLLKSTLCSPKSVLDQRRRSEVQSSSSSSCSDVDGVRRYTYEELSIATGCFATENLVGSGGCCSVYRGVLADGSLVAVKKLADSKTGHREFSREIKVISFIWHENLLSLLGFCTQDPHRLLVYELMQNGCLQQHLKGDDSLSWRCRQTVALGAARGLQHLHELSPHHVIHQDVKSSNILLSEDFDARISDFGFSKWSNELLNSTGSGLLGTFGYMAPEYMVHGVASERTDVYAFGVVLLEIITGRSPIDFTLPSKKQSIVHWALSLEETGTTYEMVDRRLRDLDSYELRRMMHAALLCVRRAPEERPSMKRLVNILDPDVTCPEPLLSKHT